MSWNDEDAADEEEEEDEEDEEEEEEEAGVGAGAAASCFEEDAVAAIGVDGLKSDSRRAAASHVSSLNMDERLGEGRRANGECKQKLKDGEPRVRERCY